MENTALYLILMFVLICLSAFFSASETAYSSLNRVRLKSMAERGERGAARALKLCNRYDDLLSTILVGNNLVNIAMASLGTVLFVRWIGDSGVSVSTAVITVLVLIFGEITPKSIAKETPERFAIGTGALLSIFLFLLTPVNKLFGLWKSWLCRLFKFEEEPAITQDELLTIVEEAQQEGGMNEDESELLKSAIEFHDLDVCDILTPRIRVEGIAIDMSPEEIAECFETSGFSRLPVYEETIDHIIGILHQKVFYQAWRKDPNVDIRPLLQKTVYVPETAKISDTLRLLQRTQSQIAVVTDEYGGTMGIVSMEDILEELVGEIWDEHDEVEEPFRLSENGNVCRVNGTADIEDLLDKLNLKAETEATTAGGWAMELLERVPAEGEKFRFGDWEITITKMEGPVIEEMEMRKNAGETPAAGRDSRAK